MKLLEEYMQTEYGNSWMTYDSDASFTGRKKYLFETVIAKEVSYRKHPFFFNWLNRKRTRWVPVDFIREVEIK